jgi:hypothetical protein
MKEARLTDAGLAGDEQQLPTLPVMDAHERLMEEVEFVAALDEHRGGSG